jgi:GDPmannose 4,6-dehydratase
MHAILAQDTPEDFVIGTGVTHSVRDFIEAAATALNMNITWEGKGIEEVGKDQHGNVIIRIDEKFYRPNEVDFLRADSTKAQEKLGWKPSVSFTELVAMMVQNDLKEAKKLL